MSQITLRCGYNISCLDPVKQVWKAFCYYVDEMHFFTSTKTYSHLNASIKDHCYIFPLHTVHV